MHQRPRNQPVEKTIVVGNPWLNGRVKDIGVEDRRKILIKEDAHLAKQDQRYKILANEC